MKFTKFLLSLLTLSLCGCTFTFTGDDEPPAIEPTEIVLKDENIELNIGKTKTLSYSIKPSGADTAVTWSSSDNDICSVSNKGVVTALAVGNANVTVKTVNGLTDSCVINVVPTKVTGIKLDKTVLSMQPNTTYTITATIIPTNAEEQGVTWSSSNTSVATVNNGTISAHNTGSASIIATSVDGGFTATCALTVIEEGNPNSLWDESQNNLRQGVKNLNFYNLNDLHGAVDYNESSSEPGLAKLATYLKNKRSANVEGTVFTCSGDMWQGSADSNITKGKLVNSWMNYLGFSAMAIGNHEFDWTIDVIKENIQQMNFPLLACNIIQDSNNELVDWIEPYTTITKNGVHIGIIGSVGENLTSSILATNVKGLSFKDPTPYVKKWSTYLKDNGADFILYLSHNSADSVDSSLSSYVDAVFLGHTHQSERTTINGIPAIQGASNGKYVSYIDATYDFSTKKINYSSYGNDNTNLLSAANDSGTATVWAEFSEEINQTKNRIVSSYTKDISSYDVPHIYNQYAYKYYLETKDELDLNYDIFAVETNGARSTIYATSSGITYGAVYKALPFDNLLTLVKIKGSYISKFVTYSSSRWYLPSVGVVDRGNVTSYVKNTSSYYYLLIIDYISLSEYNAQYVSEYIYSYYQEEALPRNIVSNYLSGYPNNVTL